MLKNFYPIGIVAPQLHYLGRVFYFMKFLEKDLEQIIFESGMDSLNERGLYIRGKRLRQVRIGNYGIADLITFQRPFYDGPEHEFWNPGRITIYELKKEHIGISAFLQAVAYARGINRYLQKRDKNDKYIIDIKLIGRDIDKNGAFCYIPQILNVHNQYYDLSSNMTEPGVIEFITYEYAFIMDIVYVDILTVENLSSI